MSIWLEKYKQTVENRLSRLKYAHYDGTSWQTEIVDCEGQVGAYISLALDTAERPHIGCCRYDSLACDAFEYAYNDGTIWQIETITTAGGLAGDYTSLVLDLADRPHVVSNGPGIKYAWRDGTSQGWQIEPVNGLSGGNFSLALDATGRPHISYCDQYPTDELRYAHRVAAIPLPETGLPGVALWMWIGAGILIGVGLALRWWLSRGVVQ